MLNSSSKYKADLKADKNIEKILIGCKLNTDLLIAEENNNIILFNIKSGKKILAIPFHNKRITSFHIVKRPLYINNKLISFSNDSFYFLTSSLDKKFALHQISYNNSTKEYSNYKLISQCQPTNDEVNRVIQIENGQILVATRDQHLILFNNKITKGNFEKLFEIKMSRYKNAVTLFEIRNNLIGVSWEYDDAEADE
jgi:WD40 repeat protein